MQQILAYETDLLEYADIFDDNPAIAAKVAALKASALEELAQIDAMGGAVAAIPHMKSRLVEANSDRLGRIERGEQVVVGVNRYREAEPSPLTAGIDSIFTTDPAAEADQITRLHTWRSERDGVAVNRALLRLREAALSGENIMPPSIAAAKAGVTTGEWGAAIRAAFGEYRAPTGVNPAASNRTEGLEPIRAAVDLVSSRLGRRLKLLIGKPGLDGHSNGAEQITARARDCGMAIHYDGIRHTPADIVAQALEENPHVIGLSILSGSHMPLVADVLAGLREAGLSTPLIIGGIIPDADAQAMLAMGVAAIYTPKDFDLNRIMFDIVGLAEGKAEAA